LHAAAARALEQAYAARLEDAYDRLAYHYSRAEDAEKAVDYLTRFAEKAAREHAHVEVILPGRAGLYTTHCTVCRSLRVGMRRVSRTAGRRLIRSGHEIAM
jgi:hypothetical protein